MSRLNCLMIAAAAMVVSMNGMLSQAVAAEKEVVAYRLTKTKTLEFDDQKKADLHYTTVKKLGCEVKKEDHNGHVDVTYRCTSWRQIELTSHKAAHNWERWLKASGFETKHTH